jgi:hypothetical protein
MDEINEIIQSDLDEDEKYDRITAYFEPGPVEPNEYLTEEEIEFAERGFSDVPDEDLVQDEFVEMNMN